MIQEIRFDKPWLTPKEVGLEIGKHFETVKRYCRAGKLTYMKNGPNGHMLISRKSLDKHKNSHTYGGTAYGK
jgi:hypothetical protein